MMTDQTKPGLLPYAPDAVPVEQDVVGLVNSLRAEADTSSMSASLCLAAADLLTSLAAENERLQAQLREAAMQSLADAGQAQEAYDAQLKAEAERDALAAQLAQAMEALTAAADELDAYYKAEWGLDHPLHHRNLKYAMDNNPARAALSRPRADGGEG